MSSLQTVVIGGGPAGASAARLLAAWGHDVRLITRPSADREPLAESLPPSCRKLLDLIGVRDAIDAAGFVRSTGNTVWWGSGEARVERFGDAALGWQVTSDALDAILLDAAQRAGARLDRTRVAADALESLDASIILDCTGRAGLVGRARGWRVYEPALRTIALVGAWRRDEGWPVSDQTHTLIESYKEGWAWSVPLADGTRHVAVMVDPRTTDLAKAQPARQVYLAELAKTARLAAMVHDATLAAGPWGWDASMYSSTSYADDRTLLVGDAGSFIDPLSSAGVKKALASGWLAAVTAHTALARPAMRQIAFEFFAAREREMYARYRAMTERYLADAGAGRDHPFWADRASAVDEVPDPLSPDVLRRDPAVQRAFERIRAAPALNLRRADDVGIEWRPAVSGCEIVLEPRLAVHDRPEGIRFVSDVDVVAVLELAPAFTDAGDLYEAYARRSGPVALPDFLLVLATATAKGWLVWR